MALRTTDEANRLVNEAVLLTAEIKTALDANAATAASFGSPENTGVMAATLASTIISTFGGSILSRSLFREVEDSELPPADAARTAP